MPELPHSSARHRGSLARRLSLAFLAVGLLSAGAVVAIVALTARHESTTIAEQSRTVVAERVASELAAAYRAGDGDWTAAELAPAARAAASVRAALIVRGTDGRVIGASSPSGVLLGTGAARLPAQGAAATTIAIESGGAQVGKAELRFAGTGLTRGEERLRDALLRGAAVAGLVAVLIAMLAAGIVARGLRTPLQRLAAAARAIGAGDQDARVRAPDAPGELGEVAVAFDAMADTLAAQRRARSEEVSDLAHELRTPLTILRGSLEELIDGGVPADPPALGSLQEEVLRLEHLTDDLRALSESEPAFLRLADDDLDLAAVVQHAAAALEARAHAGGVELVITAEPSPVRGDARRLEQVATNLLMNAIKFTPPGGTVHAGVQREDACGARLTVDDSGPGIPEADLPHVFERFWRGDGARRTSGTGVGLAIVARLVAAHGGTVVAESPAGGGARFTVRLPAAS